MTSEADDASLTDPEGVEVEVPVLEVEPPPADLPYADMEDYRQREQLRANGLPVEPDALVDRLNDLSGVLLGAALHTLGAASALPRADAVRSHLDHRDDTVAVEAAFALARHGHQAGRRHLSRCLELDPVANLSPTLAAGYLARLGDTSGFPVVRRCLDEPLVGPRMVACKQLALFVDAHGTDDGAGGRIDVWDAFARALNDPAGSVAWQAFVQLRELDDPEAAELLREYLAEGPDETIRDAIRNALDR